MTVFKKKKKVKTKKIQDNSGFTRITRETELKIKPLSPSVKEKKKSPSDQVLKEKRRKKLRTSKEVSK